MKISHSGERSLELSQSHTFVRIIGAIVAIAGAVFGIATQTWLVGGLVGVFGLMFVVLPGTARVKFDRETRVVTKRIRLLTRVIREQFALEAIESVSVVDSGTGVEGETLEQLVLTLKDGRQVALNRSTSTPLGKALEAVTTFLEDEKG